MMLYVFQELQKVGHWVTRLNPPRCLVHRLFLSLRLLLGHYEWAFPHTPSVSSPQPQDPDCSRVRSMGRVLSLWENPRLLLECHAVRCLDGNPTMRTMMGTPAHSSLSPTNYWRDFEDLPAWLWNETRSEWQDPGRATCCGVMSELC